MKVSKTKKLRVILTVVFAITALFSNANAGDPPTVSSFAWAEVFRGGGSGRHGDSASDSISADVHVLQNAQVHLDLAQGEQRRIRLYARLQLPGTSLDVFDSRALMDSRLGPREDNGVHVNYCYSMAGGFGVGDEPQRPFVQSLDLEVKATDAAAVGQRSVPLGWLPFLCDGREIPLVLVVTVVPAGS